MYQMFYGKRRVAKAKMRRTILMNLVLAHDGNYGIKLRTIAGVTLYFKS